MIDTDSVGQTEMRALAKRLRAHAGVLLIGGTIRNGELSEIG